MASQPTHRCDDHIHGLATIVVENVRMRESDIGQNIVRNKFITLFPLHLTSPMAAILGERSVDFGV
jgi:hypothetical protein